MTSTILSSREQTCSRSDASGRSIPLLRDQVWSRLIWVVGASLPLAATAQSEVSKPAAIQTQDVPPIPAEFAARLRQYQNTRPAGFAGWSPDGKGILIRTQFANSLQ